MSNNKPARLDSNRTAKPLTEIVIKIDEENLCYRPTAEEKLFGTTDEVRRAIREQYLQKLKIDCEMYRRQASRSKDVARARLHDMADECERLIELIQVLN